MPLDFLFRRTETRLRSLRHLREPHLDPPPRIEAERKTAPQPAPLRPGATMPELRMRVRAMTPRQMADWAHEMYMTGWITWDDYRAAMPPELHPAYDATIGALTGEMAEPDRPRDMVQEWEERLEFMRRHVAPTGAQVRLAERIVALLRWLDEPERYASA